MHRRLAGVGGRVWVWPTDGRICLGLFFYFDSDASLAFHSAAEETGGGRGGETDGEVGELSPGH